MAFQPQVLADAAADWTAAKDIRFGSVVEGALEEDVFCREARPNEPNEAKDRVDGDSEC